MKKLMKLLLTLLAIVAVSTLSSCKKTAQDMIVGVWEVVSNSSSYPTQEDDLWEFKSGTVIRCVIDSVSHNGTYAIDGPSITVKLIDCQQLLGTISYIDNKVMTLDIPSGTIEFKKSNKSLPNNNQGGGNSGGGSNSDIPIGRIYSIDEILSLEAGYVFSEPASVYGIVTADEVSGNFYNEVFIQNRRTGKAIQLRMNQTIDAHIGDSIRVCLEDFMFVIYANQPLLELVDPQAVDTKEHILILANNRPIDPVKVTIAELNAGLWPAGCLVQLENVMFTEQTTFADLGHATYGNRTLVDVYDPSNSLIVRTSNYADFARDSLPEGTCKLVAIATIYMNTRQLRIRFKDEIEVTGAPSPGNGNTQSLPYIQHFNSAFGFGTYNTYDVYGPQSWKIGYNTASMSGYANTSNNANEDWLISSPVALTEVSKAKMVVEYIGRYFTNINNDVTFLVSANYTQGTAPSTAMWIQLPAVLNLGTNWNDFSTSELDLTDFLGQTVTVAVKYTSDDAHAGTLEIKSIIIREGQAEPPVAFSETFANGPGRFSIQDVNLPDNLTYIWTHLSSYYCMKASAYVDQAYASESWLVSPEIKLPRANTAALSFEQAVNYAPPQGALSVLISTNYDGNVTSSTWTKLDLDAWPTGTNWTFITSLANLTPFIGQTIHIAFKYTSSEETCSSWEVKNVKVELEY